MRALCRAVGFWAAIAFIISGIVSPVLAGACPLASLSSQWYSSDGENFGAEFGSVSCASRERVIVIHPPPYKNTTPASLCGDQIFAVNPEVKGPYPSFRGDKGSSRLPLIQIGKIKICGNIAVKNLHAVMENQMSGWCVSSVPEYGYGIKCYDFIGLTNGRQTCPSNGNVSPQLSLSNIFHRCGGAICCVCGSLRRDDRVLCGSRGFPHFINTIAQPPRLNNEDYNLSKKGKELKQTNAYKSSGQYTHPPIGRRFLIMIALLLFAFPVCLLGGKCLYNDRVFLGTALLVLGWLLGSAGLLLWWALGFRSTWGWWL